MKLSAVIVLLVCLVAVARAGTVLIVGVFMLPILSMGLCVLPLLTMHMCDVFRTATKPCHSS